MQFNIFLADEYRIKVTVESESCPLNPHLGGKFFCATWCYVTLEYVHNVIEPFPWHSRDKTPKQLPKLFVNGNIYCLNITCCKSEPKVATPYLRFL